MYEFTNERMNIKHMNKLLFKEGRLLELTSKEMNE